MNSPVLPRLLGLALAGLFILVGCGKKDLGGLPQDSFTGPERDAVDAAARAIRQFEDWGKRVEYKIQKHSAGWQVTAWRVEHPDAKGNARYVPWGFRVIVVDRRGKVIEYKDSR